MTAHGSDDPAPASTSAPLLDETSLHGRPARFATGLVDVAENTCAWLQPNGDWSESNAGLVIGDGRAALIDTAWDLRLTQRIIDAARQRTSAPITTLVVTHGDGDHVNGCQLLPGAELVCTEATAEDMAHEDPAGLRRSHLGARLLRTVTVGPPRRFGSYIAAMFDPFDFSGIRIRTPDRTFEDRLDLDVGGRTLELRRLGPAHTAGDTIVHVPDVRTVFAGDLLFDGVTPNSWSGTITGWRRALEQIAALDPAVVVPGHGPVSDLGGVAELDRYWAWLQAAAIPLLSGGMSVGETARRIALGDDFLSQPWGSWECPERTALNVVTIDRERRGVSPVIEHRERPGLMWRVARLAAQIEAARG